MGDMFAVLSSLEQRNATSAIIVGAGYIGLEMAEALVQVSAIDSGPGSARTAANPSSAAARDMKPPWRSRFYRPSAPGYMRVELPAAVPSLAAPGTPGAQLPAGLRRPAGASRKYRPVAGSSHHDHHPAQAQTGRLSTAPVQEWPSTSQLSRIHLLIKILHPNSRGGHLIPRSRGSSHRRPLHFGHVGHDRAPHVPHISHSGR